MLEGIPAERRRARSPQRVSIPTIGIGAGPHCDGQVLVCYDLLGLEDRIQPKFVRRYANLLEQGTDAVRLFVKDVRSGDYPSPAESY